MLDMSDESGGKDARRPRRHWTARTRRTEMAMNVHPLAWMMANITWAQLPGYVGAVFVVLSFVMKTMIPLRVMTILSNVCFIWYSYIEGQYPTLFLHLVLLPLNAVRIYQMMLLTRRVRAASQGEQTLGSLRPFMRRSHCKKGRVLIRKGDLADALYYLVSGEFLVKEIGVVLRGGSYVGELGLLAPSGRRTQTLECIAEGEVLSISYEHVRELFYQNPDFGYHFLRLTAGRLFENIETLQHQVESLQKELASARQAQTA